MGSRDVLPDAEAAGTDYLIKWAGGFRRMRYYMIDRHMLGRVDAVYEQLLRSEYRQAQPAHTQGVPAAGADVLQRQSDLVLQTAEVLLVPVQEVAALTVMVRIRGQVVAYPLVTALDVTDTEGRVVRPRLPVSGGFIALPADGFAVLDDPLRADEEVGLVRPLLLRLDVPPDDDVLR